jgi:hypothetical protein
MRWYQKDVVTALVKDDERRPRSHFCKPTAAVTPCCEHALFLYEHFSDFFILSVMDGKTEQSICTMFWVKLSKSATETLEMLHGAFGEYSLSRTVGLKGIHVSRLVGCQLKMKNIQGNQASAKRQKNAEKFQELAHKDRC